MNINHLAIIMDGNRRWAKKNNLRPWQGHQEGLKSLQVAIEFCLENNIQYLSIYSFSLENFKRNPIELNFLFNLMVDYANAVLEECLKNGVKINFIGDKKYFPENTIQKIELLESKSTDCKNLSLNILFCYGGRQEILHAVKKLIKDVNIGKIDSDSIDEAKFTNYLWTKQTPDPDLIIRTGGVKRLSNFLTWQSTYTELCFLDIFWPEITKDILLESTQKFTTQTRNFGK